MFSVCVHLSTLPQATQILLVFLATGAGRPEGGAGKKQTRSKILRSDQGGTKDVFPGSQLWGPDNEMQHVVPSWILLA